MKPAIIPKSKCPRQQRGNLIAVIPCSKMASYFASGRVRLGGTIASSRRDSFRIMSGNHRSFVLALATLTCLDKGASLKQSFKEGFGHVDGGAAWA